MRILLLVIAALAAHQPCAGAQTLHVLVWDEQQDRQTEAYENFLGNEIAARLAAERSIIIPPPHSTPQRTAEHHHNEGNRQSRYLFDQ